ncbi:MAG TPA: histidine phosphatase family protein [Candidatus Solibacter sp.]|jgi:broad specificity phosphatase PhoE|nr:histidine phosphatase family protein [Candidatus Solibacter sp.]
MPDDLRQVRQVRQVWIVRHGDTEWSQSGQHTGRTDLPLLDSGRAQGSRLRSLLASRRFAAVLTSPRRRAAETAALAGFASATPDADLAEWDYGDYEGLTSLQVQTQVPGWTLWDDGAPGGESPQDVGLRADRVVRKLRDVDGDVLLFSHGHFLRVLAVRWIDLAPGAGRNLYIGTAGLGVLGFDRGDPVIRSWNISADGGPD